jgi:hypothetical protein
MIGIAAIFIWIVFIILYYPMQKYIRKKYRIYSFSKRYPNKKGLILLLYYLIPAFVALFFFPLGVENIQKTFTVIMYCIISCLVFGILYLFY